MKIYFTAPLYQREKYGEYYKKVIAVLEKMGHKVIHNMFSYEIDFIFNQTEGERDKYYKKWYGYLKEMDICVADISFPSTVNVGFEIASILNRGKPVIALYRKGTDPVFVSPEFSQKMIKAEYTLEDVSEVLEWVLDEAEQQLNRRFTFVIPSEIDMFFKNIIDKKGLSRSEYIRKLIKKDMRKRRK